MRSVVYIFVCSAVLTAAMVNFVFCDGSVKRMSVGIDPLTHRYLGERNDGKILDDAMIGQ